MGCMDSAGSEQSSKGYIPAQKAGLKEALNYYLPMLGQGLSKIFQGKRVAPLTDTQNTVFNGANDLAGQFVDTFGNTTQPDTPLFAETGYALKGILSGDTGAAKTTQAQTDQYFNENIKNPTMKTLNQDLLPSVDEGYTGGNFFSTARGNARSKAIRDTSDSLLSQKAQLNWNTNQANQQLDEAKASRILAAIPQGLQYSEAPTQQALSNLQIAAGKISGLGQLLGIGSAEQTQQQQELTAAMAKWAEENQITNSDDLSIILSLLGMNYNRSSGSSWGPGLGYLWTSPQGVATAGALAAGV